MSTLKTNVIRVWKNKGKIFEGIRNSIFTRQDVELIAQERLSICSKCEFIDNLGSSCVMPGSSPCCSLCGCSLHLKVRSLSSECDKGFWKSELTTDEEDYLEASLK